MRASHISLPFLLVDAVSPFSGTLESTIMQLPAGISEKKLKFKEIQTQIMDTIMQL